MMLSITMPKKSRMMRFLLWFRIYPGIIISARVGNDTTNWLTWSIFRKTNWDIDIIAMKRYTQVITTNAPHWVNTWMNNHCDRFHYTPLLNEYTFIFED
jgi:hypothetical protein